MYAEQIVESGHKISLSYNERNSCATVAITCVDSSDTNSNRCVSSRHRELSFAFGIALYKHLIIFDGADWEEDSEALNWG